MPACPRMFHVARRVCEECGGVRSPCWMCWCCSVCVFGSFVVGMVVCLLCGVCRCCCMSFVLLLVHGGW